MSRKLVDFVSFDVLISLSNATDLLVEAISLPNIVESAHQADKVIKLDQTIVTSTAISLQKDIHPTMMPSGVPTMISKVQTVSADRITCSEMQAKFGIVIGETWGSLTDSALRKHWQDMRCDEKVRQPLIEKGIKPVCSIKRASYLSLDSFSYS